MIDLPVEIHRTETERGPIAAWLVPGDDPRDWFNEWARWRVPVASVRVLPLSGLGVLTVVPEGFRPVETLRAMALRAVGGRVFLPVCADVSPTLTESEAAALAPTDVALGLLWPGRGLVVPDCDHWLVAADLLAAPPEAAADWSVTVPGERLNERLTRVDPQSQPRMEDVLSDGRDEIGTRADLTELPPRPGEPGEGLVDRARRAIQRAAGGAVSRFVKQLGGKAGGAVGAAAAAGASGLAGAAGSWLKPLANWSAGLLGKVTRELEELRQRELLRLLEMLQRNPDEGLKYAIEMGDGS
ncbi:MAG: hypothetical protein EHM42_14915, partial [Planctomycetaceae bacterium]